MKQTVVRRERNAATKRNVKLASKQFASKPTSDGLAKAHSEIDKAVKKNLIPKATAARRKASLSKAAKEAGVKLTKSAAKKASVKPAPKKTATKKAAPAKTKTTTKKAAPKKPAAKTTK